MTCLSRRFVRYAAAAAAVGAATCGGDESPTDSGTPAPGQSTVTINGATATVTVAATRAAREQGLMGVPSLGANNGMLFVFADDRQRFFWMKDTSIPLSIAFIDANRKIVLIEDMAPNTLTTHGGPLMRYALEVNQGWFASHGITTGMTASFTLPAGLVIEADP
ncbi:MAG: DUF192 domain-containing protein [Gemmatimonadota bacterium]